MAVVCCVAAGCFLALAQRPANRIAGPIDETQVVTLMDNVHPMARGEFEAGTLASETHLSRMMMTLQPSAQQQEELDELVQEQHDPKSPLYHQWLTPAQYGARFGASAQDLTQVTTWLKSHGLTIDEVPAGNRLILFSGTAGQVAETFHTDMHHYVVNGASHIANAQDPQIPRAFAGVIGGIVSLHDFRRQAQMTPRQPLTPPATSAPRTMAERLGTTPQYTYQGSNNLFPADMATIYNLNSLYSAGTTGTGTTIAIVGRSNINLSDVATFRSASALAAKSPVITLVSSNPGLVAGDQDESTLDVEWSGATAPGASVNFVVGASTSTTDGVDLSAQYIVNHNIGQVVSTSYGNCEQDMGSTELSFYNSLWQQAATEGMSSFVSSGDSGAAGCYYGGSTTASGTGVNGLCSSPYSTCVGGTEFNEGGNNSTYWSSTNGTGNESALGYIPEAVWNESGSDGGSGLWGSTGGISLIYTQPSWQVGVPGANQTSGMRGVPDVALTAAGHDAYIIVENGSFYTISGTSAASPSFAGIMALVVKSRGGAGQGNANASLYPLVNATQSPFHPTLSGNNSVPGVTGFSATGAIYNLATGLGSVNGALLVSEWGSGASSSNGTTDFTLNESPASGTVLQGNSTTFQVSAVSSGSGTNALGLTASAPAGVTVSISPASLLTGHSATVTVAVSSKAATGAQNIGITGTDASGTQHTVYALTVTAPPSLALTTASPSLSLMAGGSTGTVGLTVATAGTYSGPVSFTVAGLPAGVTAAWSANPLTPAASPSSSSETLTLTAASSAAAKTVAITITASGDGLTSSQNVALTVQQPAGAQLSTSPASVSIQSNATTTVTVTATPVGGIALPAGAAGSTIAITSGLPAGFTAAWSSPTLNAAGAAVWTLTLTGSSEAVASGATLNLSANIVGKTGTAYTATGALPLTVNNPPPTIAVSVASPMLSIPQGGTGTYAVTVTGNVSFTGSIAMSVSGLPTGVTASWSASTLTLAGGTATATLTINASTTAAAATSGPIIYAIGDGIIAKTNIGLQLTAVPALQETLGEANLSMSHTASSTVGISFAPLNGLNAPVTFSVTGLPAGVTAVFSKTSIPAPGSGSVNLILVGSASAHSGSYAVGVVGQAVTGGVTVTVTKNLNLMLE